MKELHVTTWPDRKLPSLSVCDIGGNEHTILATFRSTEAANQFIEICKGGIVAAEYRPARDKR